jgi:hypothetical protein
MAPKQATSPSPQNVHLSHALVVIAFIFVKLPAFRLIVIVVRLFIGQLVRTLSGNRKKLGNHSRFLKASAIMKEGNVEMFGGSW